MSTVRVDKIATLDDSFSVEVVDISQLPGRLTTAQATIDKLNTATLTTVVASSNNYALVADTSVIITGNFAVYLPATAGLRVGATVVLQKLAGFTPVVSAKVGDLIKFSNGTTDVSATYDVSAKLIVTWNGTNWEIFKCQQA